MIDLQSVQNFFNWAQIEKHGLIEINKLKFDGKKYSNFQTLFFNEVPERIDVAENQLIVVGVNPRPKGLAGAAKDKDIQVYKNIYIDIEPIHAPNTVVSQKDLLKCYNLVAILETSFESFHPVIACSGNGYHILFAIPSYDNPLEFGNRLQTWYRTWLLPSTKEVREKYNVRIDSTFSPSRQVKVYGTAKPVTGSHISTFPAVERRESQEFRDYILSFPEKEQSKVTVDIDFSLQQSIEEIENKYGLNV